MTTVGQAVVTQAQEPALGTKTQVIDLFAGAGGWEEALGGLGYRTLGIELDSWACATARAAGHVRLQADVAQLDPQAFGSVEGLVASSPCQPYSVCGKHLGRLDKEVVAACAHELAAGHDTRAMRLDECRDPRSLLVVEPLRWALALRPRWVAFEQVPGALEVWTVLAGLLNAIGYSPAMGILSAERYGVPQTRKRAFLIASLDGSVNLPVPTHRAYYPRRREVPASELDLLPYASVAEALGLVHSGALWTHNQTHSGERPNGLCRPLTLPAFTLDTASGSWAFAPTLTTGKRSNIPRRRCGQEDCYRRYSHVPKLPKGKQRWPTGSRITPAQAATLQGFRHDYPWQGSRTRQFRQIGNAVCPPLARLVVAEALRPTLELQAGQSRRKRI